jgi:hypothetical protein
MVYVRRSFEILKNPNLDEGRIQLTLMTAWHPNFIVGKTDELYSNNDLSKLFYSSVKQLYGVYLMIGFSRRDSIQSMKVSEFIVDEIIS